MSKVNESTKLRWSSFILAYMGLGFIVIMIAATFLGMSESLAVMQSILPQIALLAVGAGLLILAFVLAFRLR